MNYEWDPLKNEVEKRVLNDFRLKKSNELKRQHEKFHMKNLNSQLKLID